MKILYMPPDKSILHRAIMLSSIAEGASEICFYNTDKELINHDIAATIACMSAMGVDIQLSSDIVYANSPHNDTPSCDNRLYNCMIKIIGKGLHDLEAPIEHLNCANSGTTMRLLAGILAGQRFKSCLDGDASLRLRPMNRIVQPLKLMGADIESTVGNAPLHISPSQLSAYNYRSEIASAQVKSCMLFAALYADGISSYTEQTLSRNHSELMLKLFGTDIHSPTTGAVSKALSGRDLLNDTRGFNIPKPILISGNAYIKAIKLSIPGDISSAAYFIAAALLIPSSEIIIHNVGVNPTRLGFIEVLRKMGANIIIDKHNSLSYGFEEVADIYVRSSNLSAVQIDGDIIPTLIDELPLLAGIACFSKGRTVISGAGELKYKESNRIHSVCNELSKLGADISETEDGMIIDGGYKLRSAKLSSHGDHRIAMTLSIVLTIMGAELDIENKECVSISYPNFYRDLNLFLHNKL